MTAFIIFTLFILKIPVFAALWVLWRALDDQPDQVVGDASDGGGGVAYKPGPRTRGPHGGCGPVGRAADRRQETCLTRAMNQPHVHRHRL